MHGYFEHDYLEIFSLYVNLAIAPDSLNLDHIVSFHTGKGYNMEWRCVFTLDIVKIEAVKGKRGNIHNVNIPSKKAERSKNRVKSKQTSNHAHVYVSTKPSTKPFHPSFHKPLSYHTQFLPSTDTTSFTLKTFPPNLTKSPQTQHP